MLLGVARVLQAVLLGVSPLNGPTLSAAVLSLVRAVLLAAAVTAWRAATIDPIEAMRAD